MKNKVLTILFLLINTSYSFSIDSDLCPMLPKLGQMMMVKLPIYKNNVSLEKQKEKYSTYASKLKRLHIGGAIVFTPNLRKAKTPNEIISLINILQEKQEKGLFISVDQEGGVVQRMNEQRGFTDLPSHNELGIAAVKKSESSIPYDFGYMVGEELQAVGVNWNFGTMLDIASNPKNPVIAKLNRAFSEDPELVSMFGVNVMAGMSNSGIIATGKHFPGHGDTKNDSHYNFAVVDKTLDELMEEELLPFISAIEMGADSIMVGHITLPKVCPGSKTPATLAKPIVTGLLREKLGFEGLIVTDDLIMGAISKFYSPQEAAEKAILAGNDVLILGGDQEEKVLAHICREISKNTEKSQKLTERINESYDRIVNTKKRYDILKPQITPEISQPISTEKHKEMARMIFELSKDTHIEQSQHKFLTN